MSKKGDQWIESSIKSFDENYVLGEDAGFGDWGEMSERAKMKKRYFDMVIQQRRDKRETRTWYLALACAIASIISAATAIFAVVSNAK